MHLLKYGIKDGRLVHIDNVSNGLSCGCFCPSCGGKLEAHQGQKNQPHFKHYSAADCKHGSESALHLMAKNIIAQTKIVYIPNAPRNIYDINPTGKCYKFEHSYIEKAMSSDVRCDVLLETGNIILNVEIKVTHEVDINKKFKLFNSNIRTIEIDLNSIIDNFNEAKIRKIVTSGMHTQLIYSPKVKDIYAKWWLGEWKNIYYDKIGHPYVKNCRYSDGYQITYFATMGQAYRDDYTSAECFFCTRGMFIPQNENATQLLCCALYGELDFKSVDKIIEIKRINNIVQYAELVVNGKSKIYGKKQ